MRIKSIEYENFRNFMARGKIECSTDGRVTIVYGRNGDGKTTLHQLFQWVFYGQVHFNKTATDKLYNLKFEAEQKPGTEFEVMGRISFEHAGTEYTLRRTAFYSKSILGETRYDHEEFELQSKDHDNNWKHIDKPVDVIEKLLPSGLAEYFFFDGESMIADLSTKSTDSAKKLKAALYSMFDLDILDMALDHIGTIDLKKSVLGKLYLSKADASSNSDISIEKQNLENAQGKIEKIEKALIKAREDKEENKRVITAVSEQIGSSKSKADYEKQRKQYQKTLETAKNNMEQGMSDFGDAVMESFPKILISKAILEAGDVLKLKINKAELPVGLGKTLINYLLSKDNESGKCICGNTLCDNDRDHIKSFLDLLPPKSYTNIYQEFISTAKNWGNGYNKEKLEKYIKGTIDNSDLADQTEELIRILDAEQKKSPDITDLVESRQKAEENIRNLDTLIVELEVDLKKTKIYRDKKKKLIDDLVKDDAKAQAVARKIMIMESVKNRLTARLKEASDTYSIKLQDNIQFLLNEMMDNERQVKVSPDFAIKVHDSFGDESKSEGQFAITSFAYIGGIFKMLQSEEHLTNKEYPLVLDGPFSKLDPTKIQNVVDTIPKFAPQVILFSKDSLQDVFDKERIGKVWTISSNVEQNVAIVKEGYHWN